MSDRSGNQLVLYMTKQDEIEFLNYVKTTGQIRLLPSTSSSADFPELDTFPEALEDPATRHFWLQNTKARLPMVTEYDPTRGVYVIDEFQSATIEFVRCVIGNGFILPGRIRADPFYFDDAKQDLVSKPIEFRKWYDAIRDWIKRNYEHVELWIYAGPGAVKFREQGGILH